MNHSMTEVLRIPLSRMFALMLLATLLLTSSAWEGVSIITSVYFLLGCGLAGVASLGRLWCSLYIAGYKNTSLVTKGPYSVTRNPLYFFSFLGGAGVGLATETLSIPLAVILLMMLYYPAVIKGEEKRLMDIHGEEFESYRRRTPVFFPKWSLLEEPQTYQVNPRIFKKNIFGALWFIWLLGILELIEAMHEIGILPVFWEVF